MAHSFDNTSVNGEKSIVSVMMLDIGLRHYREKEKMTPSYMLRQPWKGLALEGRNPSRNHAGNTGNPFNFPSV